MKLRYEAKHFGRRQYQAVVPDKEYTPHREDGPQEEDYWGKWWVLSNEIIYREVKKK